jgi:ParB family chromosome partitioning protein
MAVLPESAGSLRSLASLGQETMAVGLQSWQRAREARLRNLLFKLTPAQLETVEEALSLMLPAARQDPRRSPNARGTALYLVCESFLSRSQEQ